MSSTVLREASPGVVSGGDQQQQQGGRPAVGKFMFLARLLLQAGSFYPPFRHGQSAAEVRVSPDELDMSVWQDLEVLWATG